MLLRLILFSRRLTPARMLLGGYLSYVLAGWLVLSLPAAQSVPVGLTDTLFIATSALSTTGLVTVDPGQSFSWFGEVVILVLMQAGGLGYMTIGSFAWLAIQHRLSGVRTRALRAGFGLPEGMDGFEFLRAVVIFTFAIEAAGALAFWAAFSRLGVENAAWQAVFHAVSAFCTAGFSLFPTSLEAFRADVPVNLIAAALSIAGAMGFLVFTDLWHRLRGRARPAGPTAQIILVVTFWLIAGGTLLLVAAEPSIVALPREERLLTAFFQAMSAATTVGFDTLPIGGMGLPALLLLVALMFIGASPAGTGGGLKTTTFAALTGLVRAVLREEREVAVAGLIVSEDRVRLAAATLCYALGLTMAATFALSLTEPALRLEQILFEVVSALATVGLSTGVTAGLSEPGKLIVTLLMFAGRVGILTFGIAMAFGSGRRRQPPARGPSLPVKGRVRTPTRG